MPRNWAVNSDINQVWSILPELELLPLEQLEQSRLSNTNAGQKDQTWSNSDRHSLTAIGVEGIGFLEDQSDGVNFIPSLQPGLILFSLDFSVARRSEDILVYSSQMEASFNEKAAETPWN